MEARAERERTEAPFTGATWEAPAWGKQLPSASPWTCLGVFVTFLIGFFFVFLKQGFSV